MASRAKLIVVTGGEPLMHNLEALTAALQEISPHVHLETSGAYALSGRFSWITLSPKRNLPPHPSIYAQADELKVVVADPTDLEWAEEQAHLSPEGIPKRLQPEWSTPESNALVYQYILENPAWQMSLQTHKYIGVH